MSDERGFRNYLAGAALAFGVVLLVSQILQLAFGGLSMEEREPLLGMMMNFYLAAHVAGGFLGGFLVSRRKRSDYIQTGTIVAVLAYIFEFAYNVLIERMLTDIWALVSMLVGGIVGSMFLRAKLEKERLEGLKDNGSKS